MKNKELIYWIDLTGPAPFDEVVRMSIINTNNQVLFDHMFGTKIVDWWHSEINGIRPEETFDKPLFQEYKNEIQEIFNSADKLVTFYPSNTYVKKQTMSIHSNTMTIDLADLFCFLGDNTDSIENLCTYYGYNLPANIYERSGIDYAQAINYCWHKMLK